MRVEFGTQIDSISIEDIHAHIYHKNKRLKKNIASKAKVLSVQCTVQNEKPKNVLFPLQEFGTKTAECRKRQRAEGKRGAPYKIFLGTHTPLPLKRFMNVALRWW